MTPACPNLLVPGWAWDWGRQGHIPGTTAKDGRDPELSSGVW